MSRKCGSLDVSQPDEPPWAVTRIAFTVTVTSAPIAAEHLSNVQRLVVSLQMNECMEENMQQAKLSFYECVLPCSIYPVL
jgi:hypothetical protein